MRFAIFLFLIGIVLFVSSCCKRRYVPQRTVTEHDKIKTSFKRSPTPKSSKNFKPKVLYQSEGGQAVLHFQTSSGKIAFSDSRLKSVVENLEKRKFSKAAQKIMELRREYPPATPQREVLDYLYADTIFSNNELELAREEYEKFLKNYPDSPLRENIEKALEFIENIKKYKKMYVPPEKDTK